MTGDTRVHNSAMATEHPRKRYKADVSNVSLMAGLVTLSQRRVSPPGCIGHRRRPVIILEAITGKQGTGFTLFRGSLRESK